MTNELDSTPPGLVRGKFRTWIRRIPPLWILALPALWSLGNIVLTSIRLRHSDPQMVNFKIIELGMSWSAIEFYALFLAIAYVAWLRGALRRPESWFRRHPRRGPAIVAIVICVAAQTVSAVFFLDAWFNKPGRRILGDAGTWLTVPAARLAQAQYEAIWRPPTSLPAMTPEERARVEPLGAGNSRLAYMRPGLRLGEAIVRETGDRHDNLFRIDESGDLRADDWLAQWQLRRPQYYYQIDDQTVRVMTLDDGIFDLTAGSSAQTILPSRTREIWEKAKLKNFSRVFAVGQALILANQQIAPFFHFQEAAMGRLDARTLDLQSLLTAGELATAAGYSLDDIEDFSFDPLAASAGGLVAFATTMNHKAGRLVVIGPDGKAAYRRELSDLSWTQSSFAAFSGESELVFLQTMDSQAAPRLARIDLKAGRVLVERALDAKFFGDQTRHVRDGVEMMEDGAIILATAGPGVTDNKRFQRLDRELNLDRRFSAAIAKAPCAQPLISTDMFYLEDQRRLVPGKDGSFILALGVDKGAGLTVGDWHKTYDGYAPPLLRILKTGEIDFAYNPKLANTICKNPKAG